MRYKQKYYIADPGENTVDFGQEYIAEVMIEAKFEKFNPLHTTYNQSSSLPFHQLVDKGGAHNPVAWGSVPQWFKKDFELYDSPKGYGLVGNTTNQDCGWFTCTDIAFYQFNAVVE